MVAFDEKEKMDVGFGCCCRLPTQLKKENHTAAPRC